MELLLGFVLGAAVVGKILYRPSKPPPKPNPRAPSEEGRQWQHEIHNFLSYTGERQEEFCE